ncbi:MAG: hypothetical protein WC822_02410 [Candidatus Paceibacterota bacterium]|jgi:hypothetical protein
MGWNEVGKGGGSGDYLKLEPGQKVKVHILSDEPFSFAQVYNSDIKRGVRVPDDFKRDGVKPRFQHAVVVWSMDDAAIRVWIMSNTTGKKLKNIFDSIGALSEVDIILARVGSGLDTEYSVVNVPTKFDPSVIEGVELPVLEELLAPESEETIDKVLAGEDPSTSFDPDALEKEAGEPEKKDAAPAKPAPAKPEGGNGNGGNEKTDLLRKCIHAFSTKPKYKDPKAKTAAIASATKSKALPKGKAMLSQCSLDELKRVYASVK